MTNQELFCDRMRQVVCRDCPLLGVTEREWQNAVQPGVTPEEASVVVGKVMPEAYDSVDYAVGERSPDLAQDDYDAVPPGRGKEVFRFIQ